MCFNGAKAESYETFFFPRHYDGDFNFCKTAYKPYDIVVCGALIVLKHYMPKLKVSSDGGEEDWAPAVALAQKTLGYGVYPCARYDAEGQELPEPTPEPVFEFKRAIPEEIKLKPEEK